MRTPEEEAYLDRMQAAFAAFGRLVNDYELAPLDVQGLCVFVLAKIADRVGVPRPEFWDTARAMYLKVPFDKDEPSS